MLIVVRHGRTEANASGRLLGRLDVPLDELGEAQAVALADAVGPVDRVVASPLLRTRQTAAAFATPALPTPIETDDRLMELDYGDYDGMALADVPAELWARSAYRLRLRPARRRVAGGPRSPVGAALDDLAEAARTDTIVVVAHVSPIKAAVAWALGVGDEVTWRMFVRPASITRIAVTDRGPVLHSFNEVAHLEGLGP